MLSIKGIYEDGKIRLLQPLKVKENSDVIITFLEEDDPFSSTDETQADASTLIEHEDHPDEYYQTLRQHKRFKAKGDITLNHGIEELTYPLHDYSSGGLSFISDRIFEADQKLTATIKYKAVDETLVMNFEIEVKRIFDASGDQYKVGCMFLDSVDEELWHTILS